MEIQAHHVSMLLEKVNWFVFIQQIRHDLANYWTELESVTWAGWTNQHILMLVCPIDEEMITSSRSIVTFLLLNHTFISSLEIFFHTKLQKFSFYLIVFLSRHILFLRIAIITVAELYSISLCIRQAKYAPSRIIKNPSWKNSDFVFLRLFHLPICRRHFNTLYEIIDTWS